MSDFFFVGNQFYKFNNDDFGVEGIESSRRSKVYDEADLEVLLVEYSCQTQKELTCSIGGTQEVISHDL